MRIEMRLKVQQDRDDNYRVFIDHERATDPVAIYVPHRQHFTVEAIFLHDIFHHEALGLGYAEEDETMSAYLDWAYPWYTHNFTRKTHPDLEWLQDEDVQTRRWWNDRGNRLVRRARKLLRYLKPKSYMARIKKALEPAVRELIDCDCLHLAFPLVVDTDARKVTVRPFGYC